MEIPPEFTFCKKDYEIESTELAGIFRIPRKPCVSCETRKYIYMLFFWIFHKLGHNGIKKVSSIVQSFLCARTIYQCDFINTNDFDTLCVALKINLLFTTILLFPPIFHNEINEAISVSVFARVCNIVRCPLDLTASPVAKIFNIKLDRKFAKVYKVRTRGHGITRALYECLMTLEYSQALLPRRTALGFPHYVFRDKTSRHVTTRSLVLATFNFRGALISRLGQIYDRMHGCVSRCRFCDDDWRCSSRYTKIRRKSAHQSTLSAQWNFIETI